MDVFSKARVSKYHLWTARNAHVTFSSPACHESTELGAFFLPLCLNRASRQPRRSCPIRIRPSLLHVPPHPGSSLSYLRRSSSGARLEYVSRVASSTRSSPLVFRRSPRTTSSQKIKRKMRKKRISVIESQVLCGNSVSTRMKIRVFHAPTETW